MVNNEFGSLSLKEVWEIPEMLKRALKPNSEIQGLVEKVIENKVKLIHLVGNGSSFFAGYIGSYLLNQLAKIKAFAELSPEFPYLVGTTLNQEDLVVGISQSGESEMTIQSLKVAKLNNCLTAAITNHNNSSLAKNTDHILNINCTKEKSILATKTYVNTLAVVSKFAIELAYMNRSLDEQAYTVIIDELMSIPSIINKNLQRFHKEVRKNAPKFKFVPKCFVLGSGPDYGTALEISLKFIESSRIFSQAYSTAEFPHGPITLADKSSWILAIIPFEGHRRTPILKLLKKVKKRDALVTSIYSTDEVDEVNFGIQIPHTHEIFQPIVGIIPAQLLAIEIALEKGINPDKPKWLTKVSSVYS